MVSDFARAVAKLVEPVRRRVLLAIGRAVLTAVDDGWGLQIVQVAGLAGEVLDGRERFQEYGFTAHPHAGAEAIILAIGGNRNHAVVIQVDDRRYRLTGLAPGEVALYDDIGQAVHLKRNGIHVHSPLNILIETDGVLRLEGDGVEIHGRTYVQTDVHGHGQRETHGGGAAYSIDSYAAGADVAAAEHGLDQPHIPSDHPEGP